MRLNWKLKYPDLHPCVPAEQERASVSDRWRFQHLFSDAGGREVAF